MLFFTQLKAYKSLLFFGAFLLVVGGLSLKLKMVQHQRDLAQAQLATLSVQIENQNAAILSWKEQANKQTKRLDVATKQAQQLRSDYQKEAQAVLKQTVSTDCNLAVNWAATMAKTISNHYHQK